MAAAEAVEDFQGALGEADGARAAGEAVVVVQHHHRRAGLREIDGRGQPDRAGADHHHRMADRLGGVLVGGTAIAEAEGLVVGGRRREVRHGWRDGFLQPLGPPFFTDALPAFLYASGKMCLI